MKTKTTIRVLIWVTFLVTIFIYNDYMTRVAQVGYVAGYAEGLRDSVLKSKQQRMYSDKDLRFMQIWVVERHQLYLNAYKENGGSF